MTLVLAALAGASALAVGCGGEPEGVAPVPSGEHAPEHSSEHSGERTEGAAPAPDSTAEAGALQRANAAADALGRTLRGRLLAAMSEGGPPAAMNVCADAAQGMAADVAREHGARVGRSSLRLRNPANEAPPWVAEWLAAQGERPAAGASGFERIEDGHARVLRPIAVEGPCVNCHGPSDAIAPDVAAILRERYPDDRATGYAAGDLRGALWAEVELAP